MLNLLVLYSPKPERSIAFYERLGMTFTKHRHGNGPEHFSAELAGGVVLEIYPNPEDKPPTRVRLGFRVADVDGLVREVQAVGTPVISAPKDSEWGRRAVVADPEGNRVELTEAI